MRGFLGLGSSSSSGAKATQAGGAAGMQGPAQAAGAGRYLTAAEVFGRADKGEGWAEAIVSQSALRVAGLCADIKLMFDPAKFTLKQWQVTDPQGNETLVSLFNVDLDKQPDLALFKIPRTGLFGGSN